MTLLDRFRLWNCPEHRAGCPGRACCCSDLHRLRWVVHNVIAHPLLVLCPPLGERLHDRTAP